MLSLLFLLSSCEKEKGCKTPNWFYDVNWKVDFVEKDGVSEMDTIEKYYYNYKMRVARKYHVFGGTSYKLIIEIGSETYNSYTMNNAACVELVDGGTVSLITFLTNDYYGYPPVYSPYDSIALNKYRVLEAKKGKFIIESISSPKYVFGFKN